MADRGSATYLSFISDLLASEESRKASLETRGIAVVTTSGALVGLLFGLVAAITGSKAIVFPSSARVPLLVGGTLLVVAAILGILANVPFLYKAVNPVSLTRACTDYWMDAPVDAELMVASTQIGLYANARSTNSLKALLLLAALTAEVAALIPIVIGAVNMLPNR